MNVRRVLKNLFINQPTNVEYIPRQSAGNSIPRIIHQTHRSLDSLPPAVLSNIDNLKSMNSNWEYRFYDNAAASRFIEESYGPVVLDYFKRIDERYGAARADLFRYLLMYRVGGVYLDIKSTVLRPLDEILQADDRFVLAHWPRSGRFENPGIHWDLDERTIPGGEFEQWHIMCAPGHPYMYNVIQAVMRNIDCYIPSMHRSGQYGVIRLTGPIAYTLAILPVMRDGLHRLANSHEDLFLEYSIYQGSSDHKQLSSTHYTNLTIPIVRARWSRKILSGLYNIFQKRSR